MAQSPTVAIPKRLPLVITPANRDEDYDKDARLVNGYMEKMQDGETWIFKRPGFARSSQPSGGAASGFGIYNWKNDIYAIFGATLYKNGTPISGTLDVTGGVYQFDMCLGAVPKLQMGNGKKAYNYDPSNGLVQIRTSGTDNAGSLVVGTLYTILTVGSTDFTLVGAASNTIGVVFTATGAGTGTGTATYANFPGTFVKGWSYLDATTYAMDAGANIYGSGLNNPSVWNPLNVIVAQIEPDAGVSIRKQLVYVIVFKQWSAEVFYDANGPVPGSPLGTVQGAKSNWGCISADSIQNVDGILFWLASNRSSAITVMMMDQLKVTKVSTPAVDRLLDDLDTTVIFSWQHKDQGHRFYIITSKVSNLTLVYDIDEAMWSQWTDPSGNYIPIVASTFTSDFEHLVQHESDGYLYTLDEENFADNNAIFPVDIVTPNFDGGTRRRKLMNKAEFIADQVTGSTLLVRSSDDDYQTWTDFRSVDLGSPRPFLDQCGTFTRRAHHLRHQCNTAFRLQAVELQLDLGTL